MGPVSYYDTAGGERVFKLIDYPSEWHALDPAFEWLRQNAAPNAVIATTVPHLAYLRTGHKAVLPPFERDEPTANRLLAEVPVSYIVIDRFGQPGISERYAAPAVAERPEKWQLVFTAPDRKTRVYARNHCILPGAVNSVARGREQCESRSQATMVVALDLSCYGRSANRIGDTTTTLGR